MPPTTTSPRWSRPPRTPPRCASSPPTPSWRSGCAGTAPRWRAPAGSGSGLADPASRTALADWLACAARGAREPAACAARELGDPVAFAGAAGHVLDFDDTYLPGLAHLSAPTAPTALVLTAQAGGSVRDALAAYAAGFEAMGALTHASHPALYDRGWHPTAVCGGVGAAVAAAAILGAPREDAVAIALLRA